MAVQAASGSGRVVMTGVDGGEVEVAFAGGELAGQGGGGAGEGGGDLGGGQGCGRWRGCGFGPGQFAAVGDGGRGPHHPLVIQVDRQAAEKQSLQPRRSHRNGVTEEHLIRRPADVLPGHLVQSAEYFPLSK